ncbi:MAG: putative lipid II flippase FtsW [Acidimicrobiia bacterium]|nr:putative lipid II flippase FtsW [Acidimicrobiia bacterium]
MTAGVTSITRARAAARSKAERGTTNARISALLLAPIAILTVIGLGATMSASAIIGLEKYDDKFYFFTNQLLWVGIGTVVLVLATRVRYQWYRRFAIPIFILSVFGLVAVLQIGVVRGGSRRWIEMGSFGSIQPSEFAKFGVNVFLAMVMEKKEKLLTDFWHFLVPVAVSLGLIGVLILRQPDLGTTVVVFGAAITVLAVSAAPMRYVIATSVAGSALGALLAFAEPYRRERLLSFLDPFNDKLGNGWQVVQSQLALGTGGVFGVGLGASRARWSYLPNAHTDFIFAIIGEETGFAGGLIVLVLFTWLTLVGISISYRAPDRFSRMLAAGLVAWLSLQALVNIGAVIGALPVTGMPLPFVSYGGSALLTVMGAAGILVNIARQGGPRARRR